MGNRVPGTNIKVHFDLTTPVVSLFFKGVYLVFSHPAYDK
jgi:hypothetical protein